MSNWAKLQEDLTGLKVVKRAKHGIHFDKGNGEVLANFSGKPCHFLDAGIWKPIDTKLVALGDGYYGCPHSKVKVHPDGTVAVAGTDYAQRVELPSARTGLLDGDKMVRKFSFGEQRMWVTEDGFRSEIQLNRIPTLAEARKLIASESGKLSKEYLKSLTTAEDAKGNVHTITTLAAFRTWLASAAFPVVIDPDFAASSGDKRIFGSNSNYATARATATYNDHGNAQNILGQQLAGGIYYIQRVFYRFDTSSIEAGSTVTRVNFTATVAENTSQTDFDIQIVKQDWSGQYPIDNSNMDTAYDGCLSGTADDSIWINTNGKSNGQSYTSGNLSTSWVNKTGYTYYSFRSSLDYANTAPTGNDTCGITSSNCSWGASYYPKLTVTYTEAAGTFIPINMMANAQSLTGGMRG